MPLKIGVTNKVIGDNIREMRKDGVPHKQAIAVALQKAGRGKKRPTVRVIQRRAGGVRQRRR